MELTERTKVDRVQQEKWLLQKPANETQMKKMRANDSGLFHHRIAVQN